MNKQRNWAIVLIIAIFAFCGLAMLMYGALVSKKDYGAIFGLGQLILEAALIPVAIIGFLYAAREFQKGQRRPQLYLTWDDDAVTDLKEISVYEDRPDLNGAKTPPRVNRSIALHNEGNNIATWYSITLSFPVELFKGRRAPSGWDENLMGLSGFYGTAGGKTNWSQKQMPSSVDEIFQSNGTQASYPGQKISLGTLKFTPIPEEDKEYQEYRIRYKIFTEVGPSRIDYLTLKLFWND